MRNPSFTGLLLLAVLAAPSTASAAQSYDSCTGTITSLPVTLTTQGTWCLKGDLAGALASGAAITVAANNVVVDCNGFKVGNLAAGPGTLAVGIEAVGRDAVTVRGCNVRGYWTGIRLTGLGLLVEDNRVESSRRHGIFAEGDAMVIRRNFIIDTGGGDRYADGIRFVGEADVRDNIVDGVFVVDLPQATQAQGIAVSGIGTHYTVRGNVIRGLTGPGGAYDYLIGIAVYSGGDGDVIDNTVAAVAGTANSFGIWCFTGNNGFVRDNRMSGFENGAQGCPAEVAGNQLR